MGLRVSGVFKSCTAAFDQKHIPQYTIKYCLYCRIRHFDQKHLRGGCLAMVYQSLPDIPPHEESNPEARNAIYCIYYIIVYYAMPYYSTIVNYSILQ